MGFLLGLDVGTSSVKAMLLKTSGDVVGHVTVEYPMASPRTGWFEQNPEDMWQATVESIQGVIRKFDVAADSILGIGLAGQMHSAIFLDESCAVIRPSILWNDTRTTAQCRYIEETLGKGLLLKEVCNPVLEGFTLPKLLWLRDHEPQNFAKLRWLLLPKDYVRFRLTSHLHMEVSDAAGTLLMNVRDQTWSEPILRKLNLPAEVLPPIIQSAEVAGTITREVADCTGLKEGTPVVGGGADNPCGAVGSGVVAPGRGSLSLGTSGVVLVHLETPIVTGSTAHLFNSCLPEKFYMMGVTLSAGLCLSWFREESGQARLSFDSMTNAASESPAGSGGLVFLPYLTGERTPHGDGNARGSFVGLSASHTRADLTRAVLEGVAYGLCDSVELVFSAGWDGTALRALGGGARSALWKKIIASVTGLALEEINVDEGPALGAAILAGVGVGVYSDIAEASDSIIKVVREVHPNPEWRKVYMDQYQVYKKLYPALKDSFDRLLPLA